MLRADAELRCLSREVIPILRQIETGDRLPEDQVGAALAYLELTWVAAKQRACDTESAYEELKSSSHDDEVCGNARRFHRAVLALREAVSRRMLPLLSTPIDASIGESVERR